MLDFFVYLYSRQCWLESCICQIKSAFFPPTLFRSLTFPIYYISHFVFRYHTHTEREKDIYINMLYIHMLRLLVYYLFHPLAMYSIFFSILHFISLLFLVYLIWRFHVGTWECSVVCACICVGYWTMILFRPRINSNSKSKSKAFL